jgi:hypothetical protein
MYFGDSTPQNDWPVGGGFDRPVGRGGRVVQVVQPAGGVVVTPAEIALAVALLVILIMVMGRDNEH